MSYVYIIPAYQLDSANLEDAKKWEQFFIANLRATVGFKVVIDKLLHQTMSRIRKAKLNNEKVVKLSFFADDYRTILPNAESFAIVEREVFSFVVEKLNEAGYKTDGPSLNQLGITW